jgi:hypothetical protein
VYVEHWGTRVMKIERALGIRGRELQRVKEMYAVARIMGKTNGQLSNVIRGIYERMTEQKTPQWVVSYVKGYEMALRDNLYQQHLMFGAIIDGAFYSTHSDRADYYENAGLSASVYNEKTTGNETIGHYWKCDAGKMPKPFFTGKDA